MQACKYASMLVYKNMSMHVCKYGCMQVCMYVSMKKIEYASTQLCKYASIQVYKSSKPSSSSRRRDSGVIFGRMVWMVEISFRPMLLLRGQSSSSWLMVPGSTLHSLQMGEGVVPILYSLSWVHSRFSRSFHRKEDR